MAETATVTIITVCYNSGSVIRTAMESVLAQTWRQLEYLIIDGGSTDGTLGVIREFKPKFDGRMRWVSESDNGMYDAINKGIRMATGSIVGILNADDVLSSDDIIEKIVCAFDDDDEMQALYGDVRFVAAAGADDLVQLRKEPTSRYYSSRYYHPKWVRFGYLPAHPSFYCRRSCFEQLGGYKTDYEIAADHELLIRFLVKERIKVKYLKAVFVVMRLGGKSTRSFKSTVVLNRENIRACRENGIYTNTVLQLGKYLFKILGLMFKTGY